MYPIATVSPQYLRIIKKKKTVLVANYIKSRVSQALENLEANQMR